MQKILFVILMTSTLVASCNKKSAEVQPQEELAKFIEVAPQGGDKAWSQYSPNTFGNSAGVPSLRCFNAMGTNQTNKRFSVSVSRNPGSDGLRVNIYAAKSNCSTAPTYIGFFDVTASANSSTFDVFGLPSDVTNVQVTIQPLNGKAYSGTVIASYEY